MRLILRSKLLNHCVYKNGGCYDFDLAQDYLRTHVIQVFEFLNDSYNAGRINAFEWEEEIAAEAVIKTLNVWDSLHPVAQAKPTWESVLTQAIVQHLGRTIRMSPKMGPVAEAVANLHLKPLPEDSPLLSMAKTAAIQKRALEGYTVDSDRPNVESSLVNERAALLKAYKDATNNVSDRRIYTASNSGIHKPEFLKWKRGFLPNTSATTQNLERFLRARRLPIPRKPKP